MNNRYPQKQGITLKKKYGQHFLKQETYVERMFDHVDLDSNSAVFEIGCGDGILTGAILRRPIKKLWVFEIDPEWAHLVEQKFPDNRLEVFTQNILDISFQEFTQDAPWTLLANLPYNVTFPILHMLKENRHLLKEGVIMIQEEVAEKILKTHGRGYGFISLYFQYFFEWKKLDKVPPTAFYPAPKIFSRLLYFKPKKDLIEIPESEAFWKFIKMCFAQPRRMLRNNLGQTHYDATRLSDELLQKRAQELSFQDFLQIWNLLLQK